MDIRLVPRSVGSRRISRGGASLGADYLSLGRLQQSRCFHALQWTWVSVSSDHRSSNRNLAAVTFKMPDGGTIKAETVLPDRATHPSSSNHDWGIRLLGWDVDWHDHIDLVVTAIYEINTYPDHLLRRGRKPFSEARHIRSVRT